MIVWIEKPLVLAIHDRQLAEHGGRSGLRDEGLLESALARPQQPQAYGDPPPDLAELAASLAFGLARNHPFVGVNKRTAAVVCETFLNLNSVTLLAEDAALFPVLLELAEGKLAPADFAAWLRPHLQTSAPDRVQEPRKRYAARKRKAAAVSSA